MTLLFSQSLFGFVLLQKVLLNEGLITREKLSQYASQTSYSLATNITVLSAQLNTKCLFTLLFEKRKRYLIPYKTLIITWHTRLIWILYYLEKKKRFAISNTVVAD